MFSNDLANIVFSVISILAILPALWIARRFLAVILSRAKDGQVRLFLSKPAGQLIVWLALGAIFIFPLLEILGWLSDLLGLFDPAAAGRTAGDVVYTLLMLAASAVVYLLVLWIGNHLLSEQPKFRSRQAGAGKLEKLFALLAIASLVNQMVKHILSQVLLFPIPGQAQLVNRGAGAVLVAGVVGVVLFSLLLALLSSYLPLEEETGEKGR